MKKARNVDSKTCGDGGNRNVRQGMAIGGALDVEDETLDLSLTVEDLIHAIRGC